MCQTERFSLWVLQIVGLLALLALCLFLALRPRSPNFTIVDLSLNSLNHTKTDYGNGTINFRLEIQNPNSDSSILYIDGMLISFFHDGENKPIGTSNFMQGFNQKKKSKETYGAEIHANGGGDGWRDLRNAIRTSGVAELNVDVKSKVRYSTWGVKSKHHTIHKSAKVPIDGNGQIAKKKKKIKLKNASKKLI